MLEGRIRKHLASKELQHRAGQIQECRQRSKYDSLYTEACNTWDFWQSDFPKSYLLVSFVYTLLSPCRNIFVLGFSGLFRNLLPLGLKCSNHLLSFNHWENHNSTNSYHCYIISNEASTELRAIAIVKSLIWAPRLYYPCKNYTFKQ